MTDRPLKPRTIAAQALGAIEPETKGVALPVHVSTTFIRDPDNQYRSGRSYARADNPTYDQAEAVLASYNWAPNSDRYRRLSLLVDTMFDKVGQLQRPPFHPKWKEMAPRATVSGWTRFKAAQEWLDRNMPLPAGTAVSAASGAAPAPAPVAAPAAALAPQDRDPLYREFLEWRASRSKAGASR